MGGTVRWRRWGLELYFALLRFLFPTPCAICQGSLEVGSRSVVCGACWGRVRLLAPPFCPRCGRPFVAAAMAYSPAHRCQACRVRKPHFLLARSAALYARDESLREILLLFKHGRRIAVGRHLGRLMAEQAPVRFDLSGIDVVIPVPLHPSRERERGFNQAEVLAKVLSRRHGIPLLKGLLVRIRPTPPQTGGRQERMRNVRGAFQVRGPERLRGRSILLIDDVYTTGATVNECAKVLMKAGARAVSVYTLARAE